MSERGAGMTDGGREDRGSLPNGSEDRVGMSAGHTHSGV